MQTNKFSHEELQKNIPDLVQKKEGDYLYHEGYVYYSIFLVGDLYENTAVFRRAKDDGTEITTFDITKKQSTRDSNYGFWAKIYHYHIPMTVDGYVYFKIIYEEMKRRPLGERPSDGYDEERILSELIYKVKADGISDLEFISQKEV